MFEFELEKGSKKHICPSCGQKRFVRYISRSTKKYVSDDVGRCDRESSCGYHYTPKSYFSENTGLANGQTTFRFRETEKRAKRNRILSKDFANIKSNVSSLTRRDFIPKRFLLRSIRSYEKNRFVQFLLRLFPRHLERVQRIVIDYRIGTTPDSRTIFWQIDRKHRIRTGKIIAYDANTGRRTKSIFPNWVHAELKKYRKLQNDFNLQQCFFGEHLLVKNPSNKVAIVEAEKTAIVCSIVFPETTWLAIGAKAYLKDSRFQVLVGRKIILFPDADAYKDWNERAAQAQRKGFNVRASNLIELCSTPEEKSAGYDLADYLANGQILKH